jgi:hypothetical protein
MKDPSPNQSCEETPPQAEPARDLVSLLSQQVVGQSSATKAIVPCVYMYQSGLAPENRPAGAFLLLGPTGTDGETLSINEVGHTSSPPRRPVILIVDDNRDLLLFLATELKEEDGKCRSRPVPVSRAAARRRVARLHVGRG